MPFPVPTPEELTRRAEAEMERAVLAAKPDASPAAVARAVRSPRGMLAAIVRTNVMAAYELHLHLAWWGKQLFADTAELENLVRHCDVWGIRQRSATQAVGRVTMAGLSVALAIPAGVQMRLPSGGIAETLAAAVTGGDMTATVDVRAVEAGVDGNADAGAVLPLVSPVLGLAVQQAVVDADGLAGGAAVEDAAALLARYLERIREPPHGGANFDYQVWVQNAFAAARVAVARHYAGLGTVGVVVAMGTAADPRAPNPAEIEAIAFELDRLRPATAAEIHVIAATLTPVPLQLAVEPDTAAVRAGIEAAYRAHFAAEAEIGQVMRRSRISEAISSAAGEWAHWIELPATDVLPGPTTLLVPGVVTWVAS